MKQNRISASILTSLLLMSAVACSTGGQTDVGTDADSLSDTTAAPVETEPLDALDARQLVDDGLGTADFGGAPFVILGRDIRESQYVMEHETGDVMDDAVYRRNAAVSERFNVTLSYEGRVYDEQPKHMKNSVMAGEDTYQLYIGHVVAASGAVQDSIFRNWYSVPHIDFSKPWWSPSNQTELTYDGKCFLAVGDLAQSAIANTYCIYFNKQLAAEYDLPDLYQTVLDGAWTIDTMIGYAKEVYRDLNGDASSDADDIHGFSIWLASPVNTFLWSFGEKICKQDSSGAMVLDYYNDKVVGIYEKLYSLIWDGNTTYTAEETECCQKFLNGKSLFLPEGFYFASGQLRSLDTDYGILPYPKWDEAQASYQTMVDGSHEILAIPVTVGDLEFVGTITEALNAESYKNTVPAYYDLVLKTKGTRDEESVAIIDMITNGRVFDFGYVFGSEGPAFWPQNLMSKKNADITSHYEKNYKRFETKIEKLFDYFEDWEENQ